MVAGYKRAEFRCDDRHFAEDDVLEILEWDPRRNGGEYTGAYLKAVVTDIQRGPDWGIPKGYVMLSVRIIFIDSGGCITEVLGEKEAPM
jgi:hypothetical protein